MYTPLSKMLCKFRGPRIMNHPGGEDVHVCKLHKLCTFYDTGATIGGPGTNPVVVCETCGNRPLAPDLPPPQPVGGGMVSINGSPVQAPLPPVQPAYVEPRQGAPRPAPKLDLPPSYFFNRHNQNISLNGLYAGHPCFLVCGGPSLNQLDLSKLQQRGVMVAAVNNIAATHVRPHVWFSVDPVKNFQEAVWLDPGITKFVFRKYRLEKIHGWDGDRLVSRDRMVKNCPNVVFVDHSHGWDSESFLTMPRPTWGPNETDQYPGGPHKCQSVMLIALRVLHTLGVRDVFLLGADFKVDPEQPYAFGKGHANNEDKSGRNDHLFRWLDKRFAEMRGHFEKHDYRVWNCTKGSELTAFPTLAMDDALAMCQRGIPREIRTEGHYFG